MAPKAKEAAAPKAKADAKAKAKAKAQAEEEEKDRVQAPDRAAFEEETAKIQEAIDNLQKKSQELSAKISSRSGGKDEFFAKKAELRTQLDEFSLKIDALMERKKGISQAMGDKRQEGIDMRNQLNKMKKSLGFTSEQEIDDRIAQIEFSLQTDTLKLKEEKDLLKEIQELKKNRPRISQVNKMEGNLANRDFGGDLKEQLKGINEEVSLYFEGKRKVQEKMTELMEGRKEQLGDLPKVIEERDAIGKQIAEKVKERNDLRQAFREKEREFNQYLAEQRKARQEKAQEERMARQAEYDKTRRQRQAEKLDEQPYVQEMTLIEQTMLFCQSLTQSKDAGVKEEKKETVHNNPEGTQVLSKKEDREEEFYFVPMAKKKSKGKNKSGKAEGSSKPIKHNAETFRLFDQLKLDAPITTDDIPAVLEKLEAQLENYKAKVKEWEEKRDEMKRKIIEGIEDADEGEEANKEEGAKEGEDKTEEE